MRRWREGRARAVGLGWYIGPHFIALPDSFSRYNLLWRTTGRCPRRLPFSIDPRGDANCGLIRIDGGIACSFVGARLGRTKGGPDFD